MRKNHTLRFDKQPMTPETCSEMVAKLKQKGLYLNRSGLFTKPQEKEMTEEDIHREWDNLLIASKLIPFLVITTSVKGLVGSYGLKHTIERALRSNYISNGDAILIMLISGYTVMKSADCQSPNCTFNCKYVKNDYTAKNQRLEVHERF